MPPRPGRSLEVPVRYRSGAIEEEEEEYSGIEVSEDEAPRATKKKRGRPPGTRKTPVVTAAAAPPQCTVSAHSFKKKDRCLNGHGICHGSSCKSVLSLIVKAPGLTTSFTKKSVNMSLVAGPSKMRVARIPLHEIAAMQVYRLPRMKMVLHLESSPFGTQAVVMLVSWLFCRMHGEGHLMGVRKIGSATHDTSRAAD